MSRLIRYPTRLIAAVALAAVVVALVLVVLTQTQVGRDRVARQIETRFNAQFDGELEIGRLTGNLLYDLYARDVRVRDPEGHTVIAADSVVLVPHWRSLVDGRLELRRVTLVRPLLDLRHDAEGRWNLARAFQSHTAGDAEGEPLGLDAAEIRIVGGTLLTRNAGVLPAAVRSGAVFDFTNARAEGLHARLNLQLDGLDRRLRVERFSARLPELPLQIEHFAGTLTLEDGVLAADDVDLTLAESRLTGSFRLDSRAEADHVTLALAPSRIYGPELRRLLPVFPLDADFTLTADVEGPLADLDVRSLELRRGGSVVRASGQLAYLTDSLRYRLTLDPLAATAEDIAPLLALHPDDLPELGRVAGDVEARGTLAWDGPLALHTDARVRLTSQAGAIRGQLRLTAADGRPLRYVFDGRVQNLDPGRIAGDPALAGSLTGRITLDARGLSRRDLAGRLRLALEPSHIAGRAFSALDADVTARGFRLTGSATVTDADGRLALTGTADLDAAAYDLTAEALRFDLRTLLPEAAASRLTGTATLTASGRDADALGADLRVQLTESTIAVGETEWALPVDLVQLELRPDGTGVPRLRFDSEALTVETEGDFRWAEALALGRWWADRFAAAVQEGMLHARSEGLAVPAETEAPSLRPAPPVGMQAFGMRVTAHRENVLRPWLESVAPGSEARLDVTASPDSLALAVRLDAGLEAGPVRFDALQGTVTLAASASDDLFRQLIFHSDLRADSLSPTTGEHPALRPHLTATYRSERRAFDLRADVFRPADGGVLALDGVVALLSDRPRFTGSLALDAPDQRWRVNEGVVDLFTDAIVFQRFEAIRIEGPTETAAPSRLALAGPASNRPDDTLHLLAEALDLSEVIGLIGLPLPFDGLVAADLAVTSALGQPALVGDATVEGFSLWGDPAGRLIAHSEIIPGREGFVVDLRLEPETDAATIRNEARMVGTVALPGRTPEGERDPGFFDLALDLKRLDLFFFDHFFPALITGTTGGLTGTGTITGDWSFPLFEADLLLRDGRTAVPAFNLALGAQGTARVDREGIHLRGVRIQDKAGGQGLVEGSLLFNEYRYFSFDLAANLSEFEIIDVDRARAGTLPFYGHIRASGSATLTGPLDNVFLRSPDAVTTPDSEMFIPVTATGPVEETGFLVFADAEGRIPEPEARRSLIAQRPDTERPFLQGLEMSLNVFAPSGSTVHLVFDPLIGDVISAVGSANLQLAIREDQFLTFGTFDVERGAYLFTAGDVFTRRFELEPGGTLEWDGDPIDARLDLPASYRTRASLAGLGLAGVDERQRVPVIVQLDVEGRVTGPLVGLSIALDEAGGRTVPAAEALRRRFNEPDRQAEYATSVLLTNTFLLAPSEGATAITGAADDLLFTSLTELVSSRLNLFLNQALGADNLDVAVGVQQGLGLQDFDLTYGVALRLLDERLVIRGEGVYQQLENRTAAEGLQGEVAVEVRLSDAVALEVFYRREGDPLLNSGLSGIPMGAYGAGLTYQTDFVSWPALVRRLTGLPPEPRPAEASLRTPPAASGD